MRDTTPDDPMHFATILDPGETFYGANGIRITNPSDHTFEMHVQLIDEINFKAYRTFSPGEGFLIYHVPEEGELNDEE